MRGDESVAPTGARRRSRRRSILIVLFGALVPIAACGTSAVGVDLCNQIETARCNQAVALKCNGGYGGDSGSAISLSAPPHPEDDLSACTRFYSIACLHGLDLSSAPAGNSTEVTGCVSLINQTDACSVIANPQNTDACAWLNPVDASDADAAEADADGGPDADADADARADSD
jgi:hypothetical protein